MYSDALRKLSHALIPGGAHTYAKGDDQYPQLSPGFIARGQGCRVWDIDGHEFIEYGSGLRAVTLGHAFPEVIDAARAALDFGCNFVRPSPLEVELAQQLTKLIPCADMVKFGKHGSDATSAAVKLSRAFTGRDKIAICADHPFFSVDDWFIGSTTLSGGIPQVVRDLTVMFRYNDLPSLAALFDQHPNQIACVMMEAERDVPPAPGYLQSVKDLCHKHGAVFAFDEVITGFRWHLGGAQAVHGVTPDLAAFGKGIANGFSVSALAGRKDIMSLGDAQPGPNRVFLLSTTHGGETHALAASLATLQIYQQRGVIDHLYRIGGQLRRGIEQVIAELNMAKHFKVLGHPTCLVFATCDAAGRPCQHFRALFMQEMIRRGILAPSLVVNFSHGPSEIDKTVSAIGESLEIYKKALEGDIREFLVGPPTRHVFPAR